MKILIMALIAISSLAACAPRKVFPDIQHTYRANSMSCNQNGQIIVPDNVVFANGRVTEGNCSADYNIVNQTLTISNLVGACTALPSFISQPNAFSLSTTDTGMVALAFQPEISSSGGCAIAMIQAN